MERITLREFIELRCPSLLKEFRPAWWLNRCVLLSVPRHRQFPYVPFNVKWPFADRVLRPRRLLEDRQNRIRQVRRPLQYPHRPGIMNPPSVGDLFGHWMGELCESMPAEPIDTVIVIWVAEHVAYSGLDFTPPAQERTLKDDTPIVVVLHGLTGGSG